MGDRWAGAITKVGESEQPEDLTLDGTPDVVAAVLEAVLNEPGCLVVTLAVVRQGPDGLSAVLDGQLAAEDMERQLREGGT